VKCYCHCDVERGIALLKMAAQDGYVRASYALGLVLRDTMPAVALLYMQQAASAHYLPALQELLPAREMKLHHGEPCAEELRRHLDHACLNRLLSRHYCSSSTLRSVNTSHCWNPLCGRWALKAGTSGTLSSTSVGATTAAAGGSGRTAVSALFPTHSDTAATTTDNSGTDAYRVSRMKMCSRCCRAKYCSKLCQVYDWRSGRHKMECQFL
jgi:MYND finger